MLTLAVFAPVGAEVERFHGDGGLAYVRRPGERSAWAAREIDGQAWALIGLHGQALGTRAAEEAMAQHGRIIALAGEDWPSFGECFAQLKKTLAKVPATL